jgi:predicted phosphodiesterase
MIVFVGDCHGDFRELLATITGYSQEKISGVFLLGDQTPFRPLEYELAPLGAELLARTWFILGNHDSDRPEYLKNHFGMWDRHLHGRVVTVEGIRIGGISGIFRQRIWYPPGKACWQDRKSFRAHVLARKENLFKDRLPLKHWTTIFPEDLYSNPQPVDILLTHEAPSSHPHGFDVFDSFTKRVGAKWIFHGHHHEDYMGTIGIEIRAVGLGLCQCMVWDKTMFKHS